MSIAHNKQEINNTFTSAANTLATELPADIKAQCDRILGDNPEPRERWTMYDGACTWLKYNRETK